MNTASKTVWITDWEIQCCGDPFAIGSRVMWSLAAATDEFRARLAGMLGEDVGLRLTDYETHHGPEHDDDPPLVSTKGTVKAIEAAYWRYAPRLGEADNVRYEVPGSGHLEPRTKADGWEDEDPDGPSFAGYLVELDDIEVDAQ